MHGNHCSLFLFNVQELDEAIFQCIIKVHRFIALQVHGSDVLVLDLEITVFNDEKRPLDSACIRVEANLLVLDVSDNRHLFRDLERPAKLLDALDKVVRVVVGADPVAVDEDLDVPARSDH